MDYELSQHARDVIEERKISVEWLERTLKQLELTQADPFDPSLERRFRKIPECGSRVLRVVVNVSVVPLLVVSVFFDRAMKGRL